MAPKKKFSKEDIIMAAFTIAKEDGIDAITIRRVAEQLGSSIAPIYVNFTNVDELVQEVVHKTFAISRQFLKEQNSGQPFRDMGIASIRFAKEYSVLFRDLILKNNPHMQNESENINFMIGQMKQDPLLADFTDEELGLIFIKMQIFQTGLSVMVANELLPADFTEEKMIDLLDSAAEDVLTTAQMKKKNS